MKPLRPWIRVICFSLISFAAFGLGSLANQKADSDTNFASQTIDLGMVVSDIDKSVKFYKEVIGFTEVDGFKVPGQFGLDTGLSNKLDLDVHVLVLGKGETATKLKLMPFMKSVKTPPLSPTERSQEKGAAAYWLASIGTGGLSRIFDISQAEEELGNAVEDPNVSTNALIALAGIGKASAQRRLADVALNPQMDESVRQTAANQLAFHIQHYGLMMTKDEVIELHTGWKNTDNPVVKSALASVVGSLRPNSTIIGERLRQFPTPPAN